METVTDIITRIDFWIYAAMAGMFIAGILRCLLPMLRVRKALERARGELNRRREDGSYLYQRPDFLSCESVDLHWSRFLTNLSLMRQSNGACDISDYINVQTMVQEPGHMLFGDMIPGFLTTLGILGSFCGIVKGLSFLDLSTSETVGKSVTTLISGMRTAFNTSIVGAVLALVFQLVRRIIIESAEKSVSEFERDCRQKITDLSSPETALMQTMHDMLAELRTIRTQYQNGHGRPDITMR